MAPKTSFNAVAFCRLSNVTKKSSLKLCSVRFWRHFFWRSIREQYADGEKGIGFIGQSIFYRMNRWSALIMYITAIYLTQCSTFLQFFYSLSPFSVHWVKLWIKPNGNISQRSRDCRSNNWISMKKHNLFVILKYTYIIWNEDTLPASQWAIKWEK